MEYEIIEELEDIKDNIDTLDDCAIGEFEYEKDKIIEELNNVIKALTKEYENEK